jgi:small multidrug resistance family-3 protein
VWLWWREKWAWWVGAAGAFALVLYGIVPTFQPAHFGRVYAAYGGVFVIMAILWGWWIDGTKPDVWDTLGASLCLVGVGVIMYAPRST